MRARNIVGVEFTSIPTQFLRLWEANTAIVMEYLLTEVGLETKALSIKEIHKATCISSRSIIKGLGMLSEDKVIDYTEKDGIYIFTINHEELDDLFNRGFQDA